jgi:hypothetical protein
MNPDHALLAGIGEGMSKAGLSGPMLYVLAQIAAKPGTTLPEIARDNTDYTPNTNAAEPLVARGLIRKGDYFVERRHGRPYRAVTLYPTSDGLAALNTIARAGKESLKANLATA